MSMEIIKRGDRKFARAVCPATGEKLEVEARHWASLGAVGPVAEAVLRDEFARAGWNTKGPPDAWTAPMVRGEELPKMQVQHNTSGAADKVVGLRNIAQEMWGDSSHAAEQRLSNLLRKHRVQLERMQAPSGGRPLYVAKRETIDKLRQKWPRYEPGPDGAQIEVSALPELPPECESAAEGARDMPNRTLETKVILALADAFDGGKWLNGSSDASVSKATGASESFVRKTRIERFGEEAKADPHEELRAEFKRLQAIVASMEDTIKGLLGARS